MINKIIHTTSIIFILSQLSSCVPGLSEKEKKQLILDHQDGGILVFLLFSYKEEFGTYPNSIDQLLKLYPDNPEERGPMGYSIETVREKIIKDPYSNSNLTYKPLDANSFIIISCANNEVIDNEISDRFNPGLFLHYNPETGKGDYLIFYVKNDKIQDSFSEIY